jgi:hypothetical protein
MKTNEREALRLLGVYTAGRFDVWALAGSQRASCRAHIMSELLGVKTPQSKAGVNAIRDAFYRVAGDAITGDCIAVREDSFYRWVAAQGYALPWLDAAAA